MFKKLLANLPFNPSLLEQVNFYHNRLRQEAGIRRFGFLMMALALIVQLVAALYPAQKSLAASSNDILNGISNKNSILRAWDANSGHIQQIYGKFGITRQNIAAISGQNPNATIRSTSRDFWSVGRHPLSTYGISSNDWGERDINVGSGIKIYQRPLHAWDRGGSSSYAAFHGKNKYGKDFWILQDCGNPTFIGPYLPAPPKPKLRVHKTLVSKSVVHRGDTVRFRLEYQNVKEESLATNFRLTDNLNNNFQFVSLENLSSRSGDSLIIKRSGHLGYRATPYVSTLVVKVRSSAKNNSVLCNTAKVTSDQDSDTSEKACVTVVVPQAPAPPPPPPQTPTPPPPPPAAGSGYCIATTASVERTQRSITIRTNTYVQPGTKITGYNYDLDANGSIDAKDKTSLATYSKQFGGLTPGNHTVLVYTQLVGPDGKAFQTAACQAQANISEEARVNLSKSVKNITKNNDASGTTVQSGDILEFKMTTTNVTASDYKNYNAQDYFGSVLQYADIVDNAQLASQGLSLDTNKYLHWTIDNLAGNASDEKLVRVKVKDIIPLTNTPSTVSPDYNCSISNDYGNEVTMNVDCPLVKTLDKGATSLPNTGPGTSLALGGFVTMIAGYFFSRSRIQARELAIVRSEYAESGGL